MLVLARKLGETLVINHEIKITICKIQGNQVKLGIIAPKNVDINREEVEKLKNKKN